LRSLWARHRSHWHRCRGPRAGNRPRLHRSARAGARGCCFCQSGYEPWRDLSCGSQMDVPPAWPSSRSAPGRCRHDHGAGLTLSGRLQSDRSPQVMRDEPGSLAVQGPNPRSCRGRVGRGGPVADWARCASAEPGTPISAARWSVVGCSRCWCLRCSGGVRCRRSQHSGEWGRVGRQLRSGLRGRFGGHCSHGRGVFLALERWVGGEARGAQVRSRHRASNCL